MKGQSFFALRRFQKCVVFAIKHGTAYIQGMALFHIAKLKKGLERKEILVNAIKILSDCGANYEKNVATMLMNDGSVVLSSFS